MKRAQQMPEEQKSPQTIVIKEDTPIPGTEMVLEAGDQIRVLPRKKESVDLEAYVRAAWADYCDATGDYTEDDISNPENIQYVLYAVFNNDQKTGPLEDAADIAVHNGRMAAVKLLGVVSRLNPGKQDLRQLVDDLEEDLDQQGYEPYEMTVLNVFAKDSIKSML